MKVTVNFRNVRVIVPCGSGDLLVQDLIDLAIVRYKKATGKPANTWVTVHNLKLSRDDGILYPEDKLSDVADDKEQIIAVFEEGKHPSYFHHNGGDGTSASSAGTESPDICHSPEIIPTNGHSRLCNNDVEITNNNNNLVNCLQVRRGSEPVLNQLDSLDTSNKRWSTAVIGSRHPEDADEEEELSSEEEEEEEESDEKDHKLYHAPFHRNTARLSMLSPELFQHWDEAAAKHSEEEHCRREPLGGSGSPNFDDSANSSLESTVGEYQVMLRNESEPLGIHVAPEYDNSGRDVGLVIQGIESGGRIHRDGRLSVGDRIVEVNGHSLCDVNFPAAQQIFKEALNMQEINLRLLKNEIGSPTYTSSPKKPPPPVYPKSSLVKNGYPEVSTSIHEQDEEHRSSTPTSFTVKKSVPINSALASNTKKIGRKIAIRLIKGTQGLGFSITTRDNPAGLSCPIYIKNIMPHGAAIEEGNLKAGDRLLEVNGVEVTGKTQSEVVSMLRSTSPGNEVQLLISRQDIEASPSPKLPRQLPPESENEEDLPCGQKEVLTFEIPLNDTGSAGLGVSVKGKSSQNEGRFVDLGIFVKSVIHGGAASKDGRLKPNDQLVNINGTKLLDMTNSEAMETLRKAMIKGDGPNPHAIILSVLRFSPDSSQYRSVSAMSEDSIGDPCEETAISYMSNNTTYKSLVPHDDNNANQDETDSGFSRDGFGRQSMSEKRHANLDARNTDTYQRNKKLKEERERHQREQDQQLKMRVKQEVERRLQITDQLTGCRETRQLGPGLGMPKSGSLESLQTMVQELDGGAPGGPLAVSSRQASISGDDTLVTKPVVKKKGLFRGFGSMFRFGKGKKNLSLTTPDSIKPSSPKKSQESSTTKKMNLRRVEDRPNTLSGPPVGWMQNSQSPSRPPLPSYFSTVHRRALLKVEGPPSYSSVVSGQRATSLRHVKHASRSDGQHSRSRGFDIYKEVEKAGSRAGIADPNFYNHYMSRVEAVRPISNYYEYECVNQIPPDPQPNHVRSYSQKYRKNPQLSVPSYVNTRRVVASSKV